MTETELTSFEQAASGVLRPALAIAGVASPTAAATTFGLGLVFRVLKLRARIAKAKEDAAAGLATQVGQTGLLRIPVIVADPVAALKAIFVGDPFFANAFPEVARQFKPEVDRLREPGVAGDVIRTLQVVNRIILPVFLDQPAAHRFSDGELNALFGDLIAMDPPDLRRIVAEYRTLDGDRNATRDNIVINDHLITMQAELAKERLNGLQAEAETELATAIRQLVINELLGSSGTIASAAKFVAERQVARLNSQIAEEEAETAELQAVPAANRTDAQKTRLAALQASLKSVKAHKQAVENSIK